MDTSCVPVSCPPSPFHVPDLGRGIRLRRHVPFIVVGVRGAGGTQQIIPGSRAIAGHRPVAARVIGVRLGARTRRPGELVRGTKGVRNRLLIRLVEQKGSGTVY